MKYLCLLLTMSLTLAACNTNAQYYSKSESSDLTSRDFWKAKPDLNAVKAEVKKGFDFTGVSGMSDPISLAIANDADPAVIKYLIDQPGVDLSHLTVEGRIYLHWAANKGNAEIIDYLIKKGSDINAQDAHHHTAFTFAGFQGHLTKEVIDVFEKHGVDLTKEYEDKDGANILLLSIPYDKDLEITNYLISKGISLKSKDDKGYTAFHHAAKIGYVDMMKKLVERGVEYDDNAVLVASQGTYRTANDIEVYKYLIDDLGLDPKVVSEDGKNVLHTLASKKNQAEVIAYFLDKGVNVNKEDTEGNTPFINAAGAQSVDAIKLMYPNLEMGTINKQNKDGVTAFMKAAARNEPEALTLLIDKGADISIKDKDGNDAGYYLLESYRPAGSRRGGQQEGDPFGEKLEILKNTEYDATSQQQNGKTLLHLAVEKNDLKLIKSVTSMGANINQGDEDGTTPLQIAAMKAEDDKILKFLISQGANKSIQTAFGETAYDLAQENEILQSKSINIQFLK